MCRFPATRAPSKAVLKSQQYNDDGILSCKGEDPLTLKVRLMAINRTSALMLVAFVAGLMLLTPPHLYRGEFADKPQVFKAKIAQSKPHEMLMLPEPELSAKIEPEPSLPVKQDRSKVSASRADKVQPDNWALVLYPELSQIIALENLPPELALLELVPMLSNADPVIRLATLEALRDMTHPALLSTLSAALDDPNPQVRILALQALGSRDDSLAVSSIEPLLYDPEHEVRLAAIEAISNLEYEAAVQALAGVIFDSEIIIRHHAVNALGEIGGETAILYLIQARTDPDPEIRANASAILEELGEVTEY